MACALEVTSLSRTFNGKQPIVALENVDLRVEEGELFGLLGPNGAGKTTLIKILSTLLLPSNGTARVLGYDVAKEANKIRPLINMVSGGEISGYGLLTVRENLWMFSQFYGVPGDVARKRIDDLLRAFSLEDKADSKVRTISTGQRQRMNIIRGFVTDPRLIFLDEPTLGLDVNTSRAIRDHLHRWVKEEEGKTLLLTTHYMKEAEELCDRVAIIDRGTILACDSPAGLKRRMNHASTFVLDTTPFDTSSLSSIEGVKGVSAEDTEAGKRIRLVMEDESAISDVISSVVSHSGRVLALNKAEATLEDVFIEMVGRGLG
ncbi:MAG: ATP-binding cassette domain-containing protein [Methanomassiliicoccus sp.]|nr:ATP-binding cassette domain-containing protein [Methanomassiliicoccus sp.]